MQRQDRLSVTIELVDARDQSVLLSGQFEGRSAGLQEKLTEITKQICTKLRLQLTGADVLKRKGTAYVLAVGVNQYANAQYNLKYAVPDAREFGAEIERQQTKLGRYDHVQVTTLIDQQATKANIMAALAKLAADTQPEDEVVVYFAGHGTAHADQFRLRNFWLL